VGQVRGSDGGGGPRAPKQDAKRGATPQPNRKATATKIAKPSGGGRSTVALVNVEQAATPTLDPKAMAVENMVTAKSSGIGDGGPRVEQADAMEALNITSDPKAMAMKSVAVVELSCAGGGGPGLAQVDATLDLKVAAKRPNALAGSGSSSPPRMRFRNDWTCQGSQYVLHF
jgi:hypothetical protein